ncbi:hypothetical protein SD427_11150 [Chryseobacterium sp. JJR-5R]|uniref:hypothetical protein n=1 Tax=Chryseobacterium sp. JJR-5R TaxID=3093923 RepID=UPI002A74D7B9|nr:hypothetical protein [Chryseobacterium sp. JJR-5R]WPO81320.1 hypothetical protein SD427_11150 [Chryseobacterium sp. JJR-5R]
MFRKIIFIIAFFCSFLTLFGSHVPDDKILVFHLKPMFDNSGKATSIHVFYEVVFEDDQLSHNLTLDFDLLENHGRNADKIYDLVVKDKDGIVKINQPEKVAEYNVMAYDAAREVHGKVTVEYTVTAASPIRKGGSNIDMQASGGGLTGSLMSILLIPSYEKDMFVKLVWDIPEGHTAVSSFGTGNTTSSVKLSYGKLMYTQFIVGKLKTYPIPLPEKGFSVAGLGLDDDRIGDSFSKFKNMYEYLNSQFHASPDVAFRFFYRSYPELLSQSGTAVQGEGYGSFLLCIPYSEKLKDNDNLFSLVAHEMMHIFISGLDEEWFREGIADYLSIILPYKGKFYSKEFYLRSINQKAAQYYTNNLRKVPDSAVGPLKFSTANSWTLSYSRGFLYFASLDAKLRTLGKDRKTTVLSLAMQLEKLGKSQEINENTWVELIRKEAGDWAVKDWQSMKNGDLIMPIPGAFGNDVMVEKIKTGIFDLGFGKSVSISKGQIVSNLEKDSNAEKAGLREGDEIVEFIYLKPYFSSFDKMLTVKVKRNEKILSFTYNPRKGVVDGYRWVEK